MTSLCSALAGLAGGAITRYDTLRLLGQDDRSSRKYAHDMIRTPTFNSRTNTKRYVRVTPDQQALVRMFLNFFKSCGRVHRRSGTALVRGGCYLSPVSIIEQRFYIAARHAKHNTQHGRCKPVPANSYVRVYDSLPFSTDLSPTHRGRASSRA